MQTFCQKIRVVNKLGLHARAATKLAELSSEYKIHIEISNTHMKIDAKSIMSLLMLAASKGTELSVHATGDQDTCEKALAEIADLFSRKFDEDE